MNKPFKLCILLMAISTSACYAQPVSLPNNLNPGVVNQNNYNSFNKSKQPKKYEYKPKPKVNEEHKVLKSNVSIGKLKYDPEFLLNEIVFDGNTAVKDKKLDEFTKKIVGKKVKFGDLLMVCQEITNYYRSKGYITSRAKLMPQKIEGGVVEITIDEGKYGDIKVKGNKWVKDRHLKTILKANGVKGDKIFNINEVRNAINEINDSSYMQGKISIDKGAEYYMQDIELNIEDRFPVDFTVDWNNEGQELTGRQRSIMRFTHNNLTGYGDTLTGGAILGDGTTGAIGGYSFPVGPKGTRVNFGYSFANTEYGGAYKELGINGYTHEFNAGVVHPLHRGERWKIDSEMALNIKDITTRMDNIGDLTAHRLTAIKTGVYARRDDFNGIWTSGLQASTGLPFFNATEGPESRGYEDSKYVKFAASVQRLHILPKRSLGIFKLNGQYSPNKLHSVEKAMLGGSNMRGYEPAMLLGDLGVNGTLEVRTPVPFLKNVLPKKLQSLENKVKIGYFYDFGMVRDVHGYGDYRSGKSTNFLQCAGVGIHFPLSKFLNANLDLGIPLGRGTFKDQDARLSFSLSSNLYELWNKKTSKEKPQL